VEDENGRKNLDAKRAGLCESAQRQQRLYSEQDCLSCGNHIDYSRWVVAKPPKQ
jgi:hypothetical protein